MVDQKKLCARCLAPLEGERLACDCERWAAAERAVAPFPPGGYVVELTPSAGSRWITPAMARADAEGLARRLADPSFARPPGYLDVVEAVACPLRYGSLDRPAPANGRMGAVTPLDLAASLSPEQRRALGDAAAGRPVYNDRVSKRLEALGLVDHREGYLFAPTRLGREVTDKLPKEADR